MVITSDVDRVLRCAVDAGVAPGIVALAADGSGIVYAGAFGTRDDAQDRAMTLDTVVRIESMTKMVTSVAAMHLVEHGRLGLDDPVGAYVPELATVQVLDGFDDSGTPRLRPPRRPVTLRHLLSHTAGFAYHIWNADILRYHEATGTATILEGKKAGLGIPLVCDPGDRWDYGPSTDWVGQAVERVSGRSLADYFREAIFDPLAMDDTGYGLGPDQQSRLATRHIRRPDGSLQVRPQTVRPQPEFFSGGGNLYSTGADYLRFLRMLLGGGQLDGVRILQPETVAEMVRNQIGDLTVRPLTTVTPEISHSVEFFPGQVKQWGLGAMITTEQVPDGRAAGSLTWAGGANTYFWLDPTRRVTGVLLTQIMPFADPSVIDLFAQFERAIYAGSARERRPA